MDAQSDFERQIATRVDKVESALVELSRKLDTLTSNQAQATARASAPASGAAQSTPPRSKAPPKVHRPAPEPSAERGVDWWLARAGAGLTIVAVILLYQYAVGHGWITPWVRVLTGALVGAGLMYWGRTMPPASLEVASPVALREVMMGAALAVWYITAFAASARYHLISLQASRYLFLLLSIAGGALGLKERRSGLALIAVLAGFLGPMILFEASPSIPAYAFYITVLGAMSIVLYLMRGWQSVLWISFVGVNFSLLLPVFYANGIVVTLVALAAAFAFGRAPSLRRSLVATGSDRYTKPVRSRFAIHWLSECGRLLKLFSPAAGAPDSLSVWVITLSAPLFASSLLSSAWPTVSGAVWGALLIVVAIAAYRTCVSATDPDNEITHVLGAGSLVWFTFGAVRIAEALIPASIIDHGTVSLGLVGIAAIMTVFLLDQPRFVAALAVGRVMSALAVLAILFNEAEFMNSPGFAQQDRIRIALSIAEIIAIAAGALVWRDVRRRNIGGDAANALILMSYAALLLVDARVLDEIWRPLVTASFAITGTVLLFMSRKDDNKLLRATGGATLVLVMLRLFFVDMQAVDTIWRVLLFLGIGALFLFTSRQLQVGRKTAAPEST